MKSKVLRVLFAVWSAGWLLPMWLSAWLYMSYLESALTPAVERGLNSFPYLQAVRESLSMGCIWLALVVVFWAYRALAPSVVFDACWNQSN